jgi:hypothetical protein
MRFSMAASIPRPAELLALRYGALKTGVNTLPDYAALELGESTAGPETSACRPAWSWPNCTIQRPNDFRRCPSLAERGASMWNER